ncbi:hypothetical protein CLU82_1687 [Flavobacterium sp. 5]|nr:hypothetical protein CLU82_1687 [Flavobacterium sp. 5]
MNRKRIAYIIIFASCILLILKLSEFNFDNLKENSYLGIAPNLLVILGMLLTIRSINKKEKNKE